MSDPLEPTGGNEPGIIPGSPEGMCNEDLAILVRDGIQKFSKLVPYVRELRQRFAALPRGNANIMGCATWTEFCEKVLHRTDSAVRKALGEKPVRALPTKRILVDLLRKCGPHVSNLMHLPPAIKFSTSETGKILVSMWLEQGAFYEIQLDIPAPRPRHDLTISYKDADGNLIEKVYSDEIPDMPPFAFVMDAKNLLETIKHLAGDPTIYFQGPDEPVRLTEGDGQLHFFYTPSDAFLLREFQEQIRAEKEKLPYDGDFLPDLKVGDEVAFEKQSAGELYVLPVTKLTKSLIWVSFETSEGRRDLEFTREGYHPNLQILRIATDEDRQRIAELAEEGRRRLESERAAQEEIIRQETAAREEKTRQHDVIREQAEALLLRIPPAFLKIGWGRGGHVNQEGRLDLGLDNLTLEQFEQIVEALKPILGTVPEAKQEEAPAESAAE